jgi:putative SOS response-associated peptidase YedK
MCGRSTLHDAPTNILERFSLPPVLPGFEPHFNIAPTQQQWTISRRTDGSPVARQMRWGLIPSWATDPSIGNRMINARAESLAERAAFSTPLQTQRCVILADGYYEWRVEGKSKIPMYFRLADRRAFGLAGLWDRWEKGDAPIETCTVITTSAGRRSLPVHPRSPVLLVDDALTAWLDNTATQRELLSMLSSYDADDLEMYEVSREINNTANDSPDCILPLSIEEEATTKDTKNTKNTDATEQFVLGELLAPVRPRSPG